MLNTPINASDPTGHKCVGEIEECLNDDGKPINGAGIPDGVPDLDSDVEDWGINPGFDENYWRELRSQWVWDWLGENGGWWGEGHPDLKTLVTMLLLREGVGLMNYQSGPNPGRGLHVMVWYLRSLFDDEDGITALDLSTFTAFFNPKRGSGGAWTQADRDFYQKGYVTNYEKFTWEVASGVVDTYWDAGPVTYNDKNVYKWWDNSETQFAGYTAAFHVNIPAETVWLNGKEVPKVMYFGYP